MKLNAVQNLRLKSIAVVAFFATTLIVGVDDAQIRAQNPRPLPFEDFSYRVELGDKISLDFGTPVTEVMERVTMYVKPRGTNTIASYFHPEFTQSQQLEVSAEIDVQTPSYYPPGTQFDVNFEFVTEAGQRYKSQSYLVEHVDEERDWQRIGDETLEILYYGINSASVRALLGRMQAIVPDIADALGADEKPRMRAVLMPNLRDLTRYGPRISQAATDGTFFGGFAYGQYNLTVLASPSDHVLIHELAHLLLHQTVDSPYANPVPAWLNEGNSSYWETRSRDEARRHFRFVASSGDVPSFRTMNAIPGQRHDIIDFYEQSTDFVSYLIEEHGEHSIGQVLSELNDGRRIGDALIAVYGKSLNELENHWRSQWNLPPIPKPNPVELTTPVGPVPTIPGLPTIETGTLIMDDFVDDRSEVSINSTHESQRVATPKVAPTAQPVPTTAPDATPQAQSLQVTPIPTRQTVYFTGQPGEEWPTLKPSAIIVFVVLAAGVMAMVWRRMRYL